MVVKEDGKRVGYNTDYRAAMDSLEAALRRPWPRGTPSPLADKQVLILGAGGVARPIAFGLIRRGAGVTLCNRTEERATKLAEELGLPDRRPGRCGPARSPTSSSTARPSGCTRTSTTRRCPRPASQAGMVVMDTVYHPENTMFLKLARERDCQTVSGVDMFVRQAALQFAALHRAGAPRST